MRRLNSGHKAQRTEIARQYHVNEFYDLVAPNGLVIGGVKYGFFNGTHWCFSFQLANGMDCHGTPPTEYGDFDLQYAPAPWQAPVVQRPQAAPEPKVTHRRDAEALLCLPKGETP